MMGLADGMAWENEFGISRSIKMKLPSLTKPRRFMTNREFKLFPGNIPHGTMFYECSDSDWDRYIKKWGRITSEEAISGDWIIGRFKNNRKLYMIHKKNFARIS